MKQEKYCPPNCPYLRKVPEAAVRRLPFFCESFRLFLGVDDGHPARCEVCMGNVIGSKTEGFHLISSYPNAGVDKRKTKWGFKRLPDVAQDRFVRMVKQLGVTLGVDKNMSLNTHNVLRFLNKQMDFWSKKENLFYAETRAEFEGFLNKLNDNFPGLIRDSTKNLLVNLFLVLDNSEKEIMKSVLNDPKRAASFVGKIEKLPENDNLLKDVRRMLESESQRMEEEERRKRLMYARSFGNQGR